MGHVEVDGVGDALRRGRPQTRRLSTGGMVYSDWHAAELFRLKFARTGTVLHIKNTSTF